MRTYITNHLDHVYTRKQAERAPSSTTNDLVTKGYRDYVTGKGSSMGYHKLVRGRIYTHNG